MAIIKQPYKRILVALLKELKKEFDANLVSVVVYGSVARGTSRKDSDVDLLIICEDLPRSQLERLEILSNAEKNIEELFDEQFAKGYFPSLMPILKTRREAEGISPLYLDMIEDALMLYDRGSFFENILGDMRRRLKELRSKRVWIGERWFWDLKPDYKKGDVIVIE